MSKVTFYIEVNSDSGDLGPFFQVDAWQRAQYDV